jgi:hypothetical protein
VSTRQRSSSEVNLARRRADYQASGVFIVTEADAAAIRDIFNREGELSAAIELRRHFPGITDNAKFDATIAPGLRAGTFGVLWG